MKQTILIQRKLTEYGDPLVREEIHESFQHAWCILEVSEGSLDKDNAPW
jgi:hypothetical protein